MIRGWFAWKSVLLQTADAVPLTLFLVYLSVAQPASPAQWRGPYYTAALLALLVTVLRVATQGVLNRIHAAIGLYFVSGSAALVFDWSWLNQLYGRTEATAMLCWVLLVGVVTTVASRAGFIGVAEQSRPTSRAASVCLVGITLLAALFSGYFQGNNLLSAYVPFVALFLSHAVLRRRLTRLRQPRVAGRWKVRSSLLRRSAGPVP